MHAFLNQVRDATGMRNRLVDQASDLELAFAMSEKAIYHSELLKEFKEVKPSAFLNQGRRCCTEYIRNLLSLARVHLHSDNTTGLTTFEIFPHNLGACPGLWKFLRTTEEIKDGLLAISSCLESAHLSSLQSWCRSPTHQTSTCVLHINLIQYFLEAAFEDAKNISFEHPNVLAFLRPSGVFDSEYSRTMIAREECRNQQKNAILACTQSDVISLL